jgi:hypothetical protein
MFAGFERQHIEFEMRPRQRQIEDDVDARVSEEIGRRRIGPGNLSITHKSLSPFALRRLNFLESFESLVIHC